MKSKLKTPVKPGKKDIIVVPEYAFEGSDKTVNIFFTFKGIPFAKKDIVQAVYNGKIVGLATPMFFTALVKGEKYSVNLFPLTIQLSSTHEHVDICYYSYKLNKMLKTSVFVVENSGYNWSPVAPFILNRSNMYTEKNV